MASLEEANEKRYDKFSYGDSEKLFSETKAAATGENNPLEKVLYGLKKGSLFAASEYVNLSDNIARLKRAGYTDDKLAELTTAVEAKKTAELGAKPGFLARGILSLGKSMAESQAATIDNLSMLNPVIMNGTSIQITVNDDLDEPIKF
jgi:hypothetical protein